MTGGPAAQEVPSVPEFPAMLRSLGAFLKTDRGVAFALLLLAIFFNAFFLWPELAVSTYSFHDEVVHLTAAREAAAVLREGGNPLDFWLAPLELGLPFFHYYQSLPHLVLAATDLFTSFLLPLARLLDLSRYLLLVLFPLSIFWSMRRLGFDYLAAGFSAVIAPLLSTFGLYGFNYGSYLWWGFGLYTQLWAMVLLPLALGEIYRTIRGEGSLIWPVLLSSVLLLSHLFYGIILLVSAALVIVLRPEKAEILSRLRRGAVLLLFTGIATCFFYLPLLLDSAYINRTVWLPAFKYDSFGAAEVLAKLATGNLLDYGRIPVLTLLFALAAVFVLREWRQENCRLVLAVTILWLLAYFGRPTWGPLLDLVPFSGNLLFHRFIGGFHLGVILLTGAGLSFFRQWAGTRSIRGISLGDPRVAGLVLLLVLAPAFVGQASLYLENAREKTASREVFLAKGAELSAIRETLGGLPPGRVYAGIPSDFGNFPYYKIGSVPLYHVLPQLGLDTFGFAYTGFGLSTDVRLLFDNTKPWQYSLFNIKYVLLHRTWTPAYYYTKVQEFDDYVLYEVPTSGYFDLVDAPAIFYGKASDLYNASSAWFVSPLPVAKQHPVIQLKDRPVNLSGLPAYSFGEVNAGILAGLARPQAPAGEILGEEVGRNEYRARFTASRDGYLMLKVNYHPGWEVTVDGVKGVPVMLAPGYVGINVTPGTHDARFSYRPSLFRTPLFVVGVLLILVAGSICRRPLLSWLSRLRSGGSSSRPPG